MCKQKGIQILSQKSSQDITNDQFSIRYNLSFESLIDADFVLCYYLPKVSIR